MVDESSNQNFTKYVCTQIRDKCCEPRECVCPGESKASNSINPACSSECCLAISKELGNYNDFTEPDLDDGMRLRETCLGWDGSQAVSCIEDGGSANTIKISCLADKTCRSSCDSCEGFAVDPLFALYESDECKELKESAVPMPDGFDTNVHALCRVETNDGSGDLCIGAVKKIPEEDDQTVTRESQPQKFICQGFRYKASKTEEVHWKQCEKTQASPPLWRCDETWECRKEGTEFKPCDTPIETQVLKQTMEQNVTDSGWLTLANYVNYPEMNQCKRQFL